MSLRSKILLFVLAASAVFTLTSWLVQRVIVLPEFVQLERREARADLTRATRALMRDAEFVATSAQDYAAWDETYRYVADGNLEYEQAMLIPETFSSLRINLLLVVSRGGSVRWGRIVDAEGGAVAGADDFIAALARADHPLVTHSEPTSKRAGVLTTPLGPLLVGSAAITSTDKEGPVRGAVVMGRLVDADLAEELADRTRVALAIHPIDAVPEAERGALAHLAEPDAIYSDAASPDTMRSYTIQRDLLGEPALLVRSDLPRVVSASGRAAAHLAALTGLGGGVAMLAVMWTVLSSMIARPLVRVTEHAVRVGASDDLGERLHLTGRDEIGVLGREFDRMMDRLARSRAELVEAAHVAGRAEVATSVLHNVGNVLNTVSVSVGILGETTARSEVSSLRMVSDLLTAHAHQLGEFLTTDEKGRRLPAFLVELAPHLVEENEHTREELKTLAAAVEHIRQIIQAHQAYGQARAWLEDVDPALVGKQAVLFTGDSLEGHGIRVECAFAEVGKLRIDRNRTLQILTNLIMNAKQAIVETGRGHGSICIEGALVSAADRTKLQIRVHDDGAGIPAENLTRIFAGGFTTHEGGHGIGLHGAANLAAEMGGSLAAASEGPGRGATFTLLLPVSASNGGIAL